MQTTLAALTVIGGAEYVIVGFLLGARVTGLLGAAQVQDLTPIVSLGLGWLGIWLGTYFRAPSMAFIPAKHLPVAG